MIKKRAIDPTLALGLAMAVAFVGVTILFPLTKMVETAFTSEALPYFERFLTRPTFQRIIVNTVILGATVGVCGVVVGFLFAFVMERVAAPRWLKRALHWIALVPVVSPPFAVAIATITLFGRNGLISYQLFGVRGEIYGLPGLTFVMTLSFFPVVYLSLSGLMRALDPALDEASTNLGSSRWGTFRRVTVPLLAPGIASGFLLLFVEAIADLGNPLTIGGNFEVLASRMYLAITGQYDILAGAVLSVILLVPSVAVYFLSKYYADRASVVTVTGKPTGTHSLVTDWRARVPLLGIVCFLALIVVLVYATILIGSFVALLGINNTFTLKNYEFVIVGIGSEAMVDTTLLSAVATPMAGLLGILIAFLVVRRKFFGRAALDFGTMLGIAVPGTIFGIGYLLAFNDPVRLFGADILPKLTGARGVFGGALAIVLVYMIRSAPAALRSGVASLQQIDKSIEEASVSLGADQATTFARITLPLIRPAFLAGLIYAFSRSMTTISAIIFLTTPETKIMTQQILNEVDSGRYGNAFAYCVILIALVLIVTGVLQLVIGTTTGAERRTAAPAKE